MKTPKTSARLPFLTRTPRAADLPEHFLLVRQAEAAKLGLRAHGAITYQTLMDPERRHVYLRVVANSGSGSFSDEPVRVDKLAEAVAGRDPGKPLRGSVLQSVITGKSACNSGFFAAALVSEGLLGRDPAKRFDLHDLECWQTWTAKQLAAAGTLEEIRLKPTDDSKRKLAGKPVTQDGGPVDGQVDREAADGQPADELKADAGDGTDVDAGPAEAQPAKGRRRGRGKD